MSEWKEYKLGEVCDVRDGTHDSPKANYEGYPLVTSKNIKDGKIDLSKFDRPKKEIVNNKKNYYIIDTNVFVNCPDIISKINKEYPIILSAKVMALSSPIKHRACPADNFPSPI